MATSASRPDGFTASRQMDGNAPARAKRYRTNGSNAGRIFKGDPVSLISGEIQPVTGGVSAQSAPILGVVSHVTNSDDRPFTHTPTANFIETSSVGFAYVYDDPGTIFTIQGNASVGPSNIGQFATVSAGSPTTAVGRSGKTLDVTNAVSTAAGHPFQIIGVSDLETDRLGGTNNKVEVRISNHWWNRRIDVPGPFDEGG